MLEKSWSEPGIRLGVFLGVFVIMAVWEKVSPRRKLSESKRRDGLTIYYRLSLNDASKEACDFIESLFINETELTG
jgi:hypothetical protein